MSRLDIHKNIGDLLESIAVNNNRLSLHAEALSDLDVAVLRQHCVALYDAINQLNNAGDTAESTQQSKPVQEPKVADPVEEQVSEEPTVDEVLHEKPPVSEEAPSEEKTSKPAPVNKEKKIEEEPKSIHMRMQDEAEMVSLFEKFNSKPIDDISKAISISKRFEFQNNFFDGDAADYKKFIALIDGAGDRESAFQVYHEYKNRLNWENEDLKDELKSLLYRKYAT